MSEGHNGVAADKLRAFVERAERLHDERQSLGQDLSELFKEIKGEGFDTKIVKQVIALRRKETHKRQEEAAILDLYLTALGMA